jgi:rhamnulokinase
MAGSGKFLAFDLGAESSRAIVGTIADGRMVLDELHRFPTRNTAVRGTRYWDILYIFAEIKHALNQYRLQHGTALDGIAVDSWGVDFGLLGERGHLIQNPVCYRDHRTDGILDEAFKVVPAEELYGQTGIQFMQFNSLFQLWALRRQWPEVLDEARSFLMIPDLLHYFLTGRVACEYTNASTTQALDVRTRDWCDSLFEAFNLPRSAMPEMIEPGTVIGLLDEAVSNETGLGPVPVIAPCTHDTGSAVASAPAEGENWAYLSCGTWSLLGAELAEPITSGKALEYNFTNEGGFGGTIRFLKNIMGLWVLQQCRASWARAGDEYDYVDLTEKARQETPFQTFLNVDHESFLNPDDMNEAIAAQCRATGQEPPATVAATVRAVLEGLAVRYRVVLDNLEDTIGRPIKTLHMLGGGIQNELLCQLTADATGRCVVAGPVEATAMGNIAVQAIGTGLVPDLAAARKLIAASASLKEYTPSDTAAWTPTLARYRALST